MTLEKISPSVTILLDQDNAPILNVYPLTKQLKHNPVHVIIQSKEVAGELRFDSDFLGEQPTTIDRDQVIEVITHIDEDSEIMKKVEEANAIYRVQKIVLVNTEIFEEFLETFKEDQWK